MNVQRNIFKRVFRSIDVILLGVMLFVFFVIPLTFMIGVFSSNNVFLMSVPSLSFAGVLVLLVRKERYGKPLYGSLREVLAGTFISLRIEKRDRH